MAKDKIQNLKLNSYDLIMASPKYAKLLSDASKAPIGSTTRSRAQSLLKTINKTYQQQILDQDPMLKMSYIAANKGLSNKVLNKKDGKGGPETSPLAPGPRVPTNTTTDTTNLAPKNVFAKSVPSPVNTKGVTGSWSNNPLSGSLDISKNTSPLAQYQKDIDLIKSGYTPKSVEEAGLLGKFGNWASNKMATAGAGLALTGKTVGQMLLDTAKTTGRVAGTIGLGVADMVSDTSKILFGKSADFLTPDEKNQLLVKLWTDKKISPDQALSAMSQPNIQDSTKTTTPTSTGVQFGPQKPQGATSTGVQMGPEEFAGDTASMTGDMTNISGITGADPLASYAWNNPDLANRWQNLSEAQRSQLQDVFLAVDSNMGPEMFSYLTTNDKEAFKRLFPNVPEEYMPNGATYTTGWGALTNTAEQKTKMETLESKLSTMMNTMGPDATLLKPTMEEYVRTKDEYRANLQDLKKQALKDWIDNPWAGDATVDREAEKYVNFLDTLDNRQKQRYTDFIDRSYNQYLGKYNQINATYSTLSANIKDQLARKDKNMTEIKAALKDMYAQVKDAEAYDISIEQARINLEKGYNDLTDVKNKDVERDFFKFEDKIKGQFGIVNDKQSLRDAVTNDISSIIANNSTDPYSIQNVAETWNNITKNYGNTASLINDTVFHKKNNEVINQYETLMNSALTKANNASLSEEERQYALSTAGLYQKALNSIENTYKNTYYNALTKNYDALYSTNKMSDKKNIVNILDDQKSKIFKVADGLTVPSSGDISANQKSLNTAIANAIQQFKTTYAKEYNKIKAGLGGYGITGQYVDDLLGDIIYTRYIAKSDFRSPSELYISKQVKDTTNIDKSLKNITTVDLLKALANTSIFGANNQ